MAKTKETNLMHKSRTAKCSSGETSCAEAWLSYFMRNTTNFCVFE